MVVGGWLLLLGVVLCVLYDVELVFVFIFDVDVVL